MKGMGSLVALLTATVLLYAFGIALSLVLVYQPSGSLMAILHPPAPVSVDNTRLDTAADPSSNRPVKSAQDRLDLALPGATAHPHLSKAGIAAGLGRSANLLARGGVANVDNLRPDREKQFVFVLNKS